MYWIRIHNDDDMDKMYNFIINIMDIFFIVCMISKIKK